MIDVFFRRGFFFLWVLLLIVPNISDAVSVKSYSYDKYGNIEAITDPRGFVTQYHYDLINRLERINYPDKAQVKYAYDLSGICTKLEDHRGVTSFEPDEFGRIVRVTFPDGQAVTYEYDTESNLIKLIYPDGTQVEYTYDLSNRLETVTDFSGITTFEYDERSNLLTKKTLPNGVTTEYQHDQARKISHVIHKKGDGSLLEEFRYTFDENGNRTKIEKISPEGDSHVAYIYDELNRVIKADYSDGFFEGFSYDGAGNRLSKTTPQDKTLYEYDDENRLRKAGNTTYIYDAAGNLIEKSSPARKAVYKYDFDNRLISYSDKSYQVVFEYDGNGNRIAKTVNGVRTEYINDLVAPVSQVLLKKVQGNWWHGEKTIRYVYGGSRISQSAEGKTHFYLYDSLGRNVSSLIDSSGRVLNSYDYNAFGGSLSEDARVPNVYRYCGEQFDEETGLIFLRNRYYDPEMGRFISKDPHPGRLDRPATLNPYCYVCNNPVNFVDPLGLEQITILGENQSEWNWAHFGHGWSILTDENGARLCRGHYRKGMRDDTYRGVIGKTASITFDISPEKAHLVREVYNNPGQYNFINNNCVDVCEIEHPSFKGCINVSQPARLYDWINEQNTIKTEPAAGNAPLGFNSAPLDYGGVSLSKTAELQLSLADITGAAFDPATGQIVLFGPEERYLPQVDVDDLAVAVRSVYGIGNSPQDPGISLNFSPDCPGQIKARYDGATAHTAFGRTIFEADYLLKALAIGKNFSTGQPFYLNVQGYSNILDRLSAHQWKGDHVELIRFWFVPEQISLVETEDHKGMVFSDARMKVMTEAWLRGLPTDLQACREFADHLTAHYDEFAKELPILEKLKHLGKITAIVKWLRENNIPFDTSFFANYQPKYVETPDYVSPIASAYQWNDSRIETRTATGHKHKQQEIEVLYSYTAPVSGGVLYQLNHQNFKTYTDPIANEFASSALESRPSENEFSWSFKSPANREAFVAVAQSIYRTRKPGNVKKHYTDMSFPVPGENQLSLERFYNSFSQRKSPFGIGWRMLPYELELSSEKIRATTNDEREFITHSTILVRTPEGEEFYRLFMLNEENLPLFKSSTGSFLQDNLDGTFTLVVPRKGRMNFDNQGRLSKILDRHGIAIEYEYDGDDLMAIRHQNGVAILFEYEGDHISQASGPGNSVVQYGYQADGQLARVGTADQTVLFYSYDNDKRLDKIIDSFSSTLFEAKYDDYNRAILVKDGSMLYESDFSLEKKEMKIIDQEGKELTLRFDEEARLIYKKDSKGLIWNFFYEQEKCRYPTKMIDPRGGITVCHYDPLGNPIYFKNAVGAEWRFFFDDEGNLLGWREPNKRAVWNFYLGNHRLNNTFLKAALNIDENDPFSLTHEGLSADGQYVVYFSYDEMTGQLKSRTNTRGAITKFNYDSLGQQREIIYPMGYAIERKIDETGKVYEISDEFGMQQSFDYDEQNRLKTVTTAMGKTSFTYDNGGHSKSVTDPRGFTTVYDIDDQHHLKKVADGRNGVTTYEYDAFDHLTHIWLPNGTCKTVKYNRWGQLEKEIWGAT